MKVHEGQGPILHPDKKHTDPKKSTHGDFQKIMDQIHYKAIPDEYNLLTLTKKINSSSLLLK